MLQPLRKISKRPCNPRYPKKLITLGDHLRKKRLDLGLDQRDVAKIIDVHKASIINWEMNNFQPAFRYLPRIYDFLGYCIIQYASTEGEKLRFMRNHIGLSIKELAQLIGVDNTTLRHWENDNHAPNKKSKEKLERLWHEMF